MKCVKNKYKDKKLKLYWEERKLNRGISGNSYSTSHNFYKINEEIHGDIFIVNVPHILQIIVDNMSFL